MTKTESIHNALEDIAVKGKRWRERQDSSQGHERFSEGFLSFNCKDMNMGKKPRDKIP